MTKEKQVEQLRLAAEILEKGLTYVVFKNGHWTTSDSQIHHWIWGEAEIRIKPKSPEQQYREQEAKRNQPEENKYLKAFKEGKRVQWRSHESSAWLDANEYGVKETDPKNLRILTTREVPLTYDDVMPGMVVKLKGEDRCYLVTQKDRSQILISGPGWKNFQELFPYERWTGTEWIPCTKTEEVEE